jgi:hypothetical protein
MRKAWLLSVLFAAQSAVAQSPALHRVVPLGISPGKTNEVRLVGERLTEITDIWSGVPELRIVSTNGGRLFITPPKDAAGLLSLRVATTNGVSDVTMFVVDDLPAALEHGTNKSVKTAQPLARPIAVDGTTDELSFDYYRFNAKKGETISIEVVASRIGSRLDPVLRIIDLAGHELAFCEDAVGAGRDCRLQFRVPATGEYLAEVRDITYQGGPQYYYRLRLGKFAFATCTYPLIAAPGNEVGVLGPAGERFKPSKVKIHAAKPSYATISESFVALRSDDMPSQFFEREPNDTRGEANQISLPHVINARFEKPNDKDYFEINAGKDERWVFTTRSRSGGSPCDVFLELCDSTGKVVTASNPTSVQDASLTNVFKESGRYFLMAKELADRGAPDLAYQIEARLFEPAFTLALDEDKVEAKAGGEFSLAVACGRFEFSEKISLELEGLPDGFVVENATIEAKKTNATLKVKIPQNAAGEIVTFSVVGQSEGRRVKASTVSALRRNFPLMLYPPPELDGIVTLGITGSDPAPKARRRRS